MKRSTCNICESAQTEEILHLGKHPLADTFLSPGQYDIPEVHYPLALSECSQCGHVFTRYYIPPAKRYVESEYSYDSANSPVSKAHFKEFSSEIVETYREIYEGRLPRRATDIGSNVGTLLGYLKNDAGVDVIGIEPSPNIAALAIKNGVPTVCALFDEDIKARQEVVGEKLDIIASTNVVNHLDDLNQMMRVVKDIGGSELLLAFEVPYLVDLLKQTAFDTIYHEHVNYFSIKTISRLLRDWGFEPVRVRRVSYMGGSLRVYAVRRATVEFRQLAQDAEELVRDENLYFSSNPDWQEKFRSNVLTVKQRLLSFVHTERLKGATFCCIGAATKGNTLLNYCKLDADGIGACADVSPLKVGKRMPGSAIPIVHDDDLGTDWDYGIVLPWNISDFLLEKFRNSGLSLVFPIQRRIITKDGKVENLG